MSLATPDLGVLGNLAEALGVFRGGTPNPDWFARPDDFLATMLANDAQRAALIAFVDEALGGADRSTEAGVTWLPIVTLDDPAMRVAVTVDDSRPDGLHIGLGLRWETREPASATTLAIPLFRAQRQGGPAVTEPLLLGSAGGRIRIATSVTLDGALPAPGQPRLGGIGLDVDVPTAPSDPRGPVFGLSLTGLQLPGATSPRDVRVAADGVEQLDDALLDLVLSLVKAQADAAAAGSPIAAVGGLLGLLGGDAVPDFPIAELPAQGAQAIAGWVRGIVEDAASRDDWLGHLAALLEGTRVGSEVRFDLGGDATLTLSLAVDQGPSGHTRLTPRLGVQLGDAAARLQAAVELLRIDLVTGEAFALPSLGVWAAAGAAGGDRVLDVAGPPAARADTLRVGFALDGERRLSFVLAADNVVLGAHEYATLDLTSSDALMDAAGNTVSDVADQLLAGLGGALGAVRQLLGLDPVGGLPAVTVSALMANPVGAVSAYWQQVVANPAAAGAVLGTLRDALADASQAAAGVRGAGTQADPWRLPLVGPLALELHAAGPVVTFSAAIGTSVDTLGQRCTVVDTRLVAVLARLDLAAKTAQLLPGVEALLGARERGANPPRARLSLGEGIELAADHVGLRLAWSPATGLSADVSAPNPRLVSGDLTVPVALPVIAADGSVTLPAAGWDAVQALVGHLASLAGGFLADGVRALGWDVETAQPGGTSEVRATLRLADLVAQPQQALEAWLPRLVLSDVGPRALALLADLLAGSGVNHGFILGTGHPDDPYRLAVDAGLPELAVWFPPAGREPFLLAAPEALRRWRPGDAGLAPEALEAALRAEAEVAADVRDLVDGRAVAAGLAALTQRWTGGDGLIAPPPTAPAGVALRRIGLAASQLWPRLDLEDLTGRVPTTTVHVALGAGAWPAAPAGRLVDLTTPGLEPAMFALPAFAEGEWFVALGTRADCRGAGSAMDGTPEQAARLARVLQGLAGVSSDLALVAVGGAGHAARVAAEGQAAVTDLVLLGTPLAAISLTAVDTQPTADALRLLHRLLPTESEEPDDETLALGRALVQSMMALADRADPGAELRAATVAPPAPRAGLAVTALFGDVSASQVEEAITAIVSAGLAERARARVATPLPPATGARAGLRWELPEVAGGALAISGSAELSLIAFDEGTGVKSERVLRARLRIADRLGWLSATPELGLRSVAADVTLPLDGAAPGSARVTLRDARVFSQSWERLVLGAGAEAVPVLPEARVLLAAAVQRLRADVAGAASLACADLLSALGLVGESGGIAGDAFDQLVHDPGGLVRDRLAAAGDELAGAVAALLGPLAASIDLAARAVRLQGGGATRGRFGWTADVAASPSGLAGTVSFGPGAALPVVGGLQLGLMLQPFAASLRWHHPGGGSDSAVLWPAPDAQALARMLAQAAPSLAAQVALELLRRADEETRPLIDALLDALGLLGGAVGDAERALRPLPGLVRDPAGWLRSADSLRSSPLEIQALLDALRPVLGVAGAPGTPLPLATGVTLSVAADGPGARLTMAVDPSGWVAPGGGARLAGAIRASLTVGPSGPPAAALEVHLGLAGAAAGRQAVHARLGPAGLALFLRPSSGADIPLVPFAGLGSLAAAAGAALPFLLDRLAASAAPVGPLVQKVGDALGLRSGAPLAFDGDALRAWGADPVGSLGAAVPSILASGLAAIAPLLDAYTPADVSVTATASDLTVSAGGFALGWAPVAGTVTLAAEALPVPGIETLSFEVRISGAGLDELTATAGPAQIDAGGVPLRPFVTIAAGLAPAGGRRVLVGMAAGDTRRFAVRWLLDGAQVELVASDGAIVAATETSDPVQVALRIVEVLADLVAAVAMAQQAVQDLLDTPVGDIDVRNLLRGVVLRDVADPAQRVEGLFDPDTLLDRLHTLFVNLGNAVIVVPVAPLTLSFLARDGTIGLQVGLSARFPLVKGDVSLWLENDDSWIEPDPQGGGGLFVGFLPTAGPLAFRPSLVVNGLGLRVGKSSGPLLDAGLSIESVALHAFAALGGETRSGGVQLQFANLALATSGAGGTNGIAQGVMRDTGPTPPRPAFSPALAIQKHGTAPVVVSLRAGDPPGPWWIAIQKGFGPLYLEQVGFDARMPAGRIERVSLLMDGSVSMFGLTCAVDDLQITYFTGDGDFFDARNWKADLAGLAVSADIAGVSIAGGLLKQITNPGTQTEQIEYLGMLLGRFAVYGLTVYGGYGEGRDEGGRKFTAFFAIGAVNGPIGGPPAFFLTGIGGGFGINRLMRLPTDLSSFGDYPLIQALDVAASPSEPMAQLRALGDYFPMKQGTFWFAAGMSFNSFALVDGIAVVGVQIGDGLDVNLLGLARMALPRPQAALVSIELGLLVRFSSSEGVLWVQGQLTDNSWLLYPDVKLTGGFAYVIWFKGERAGEFVLTLGGYHPDFQRAGYPQVPRLGLRWGIGDNIVIKAGTYFALTSEALMAGGDFECSASFGPAWAEVKFGAHGIVYFDPFAYQVEAYARIAAGITIDTWIFGEVTISVSLGARIDVQGPDFRGSATFEVGPVELTFAFGGSDQAQRQPISAEAFVAKYLEAAEGGGAIAHALMTAQGALPAKGEDATPDGSAARPFVVVVEFSLVFTSTVPAASVRRVQAAAGSVTQHPPSRALAVAPMISAPVAPQIVLTWVRGGATQRFPFEVAPRAFGRFPVGVWGPAGDPNSRKVPRAEMIEALNELDIVCRASPSGGGPQIPYHQVEIGRRKPLPFTRSGADVQRLRAEANQLAGLVGEPATVEAAFGTAARFLRRTASPTSLAALRGERQAPPRLGTLAEGLEAPTRTEVPSVAERPAGKRYDHFIDAPVAVGLLSGAAVDLRVGARARTTVKDSQRAWRVSPPTLATVTAERSRSIAARLVLADAPAAPLGKRGTLIGAGEVPPTAVAHAPSAVVARSGAPLTGLLADFGAALAPAERARGAAAGLGAGQTVVLKLPNAAADAAPDAQRPRLGVAGAAARVVLLGVGGRLLSDRRVGPHEASPHVELPRGTERIVAVGLGGEAAAAASRGARAGLAGWHAGLQLPYAGWRTAIGPGCVVQTTSDRLALHRERTEAGWVSGAELARGVTTVTTTFAEAPRTVLIVLDDPAVAGEDIAGRQLLLGLDGAGRATDRVGAERPPVLLATDNRSVLAYDVLPEHDDDGTPRPVVVTIASQEGWSLVGVLGSAAFDARGAIALVASRGLDASLLPLAPRGTEPAPASRLSWMGPVRGEAQRRAARARATGVPSPVAPRALRARAGAKGGRKVR